MWNPGIQYRGDQYIPQAGQQVSGALNEAIQKYQQIKQQQAYGDTVMEHLAQLRDSKGQPYVPIDSLNKYHQASYSQQAGMVQGAQASFASDMQQQQLQRQNELAKAQAAYYGALRQYTLARAGAEGAEDDTPFLPVTDAAGKPVPGKIYVKKTGAIQDVTDAGETPTLDSTGKFFLDRKTNAWKPLPAATMVLPGMGTAQPQAGQPTFPQTGGAPGAAATNAQNPQAALAWAHANPNDPRAAAILQRLGMAQ